MSEETPDQTPPKLKLSRELKEPTNEETPEEKPNLQLRRPSPEPTPEAPPVIPNPTEPAATENEAAKKDYDPKNPFGGIVSEEKAVKLDRPPPELPSKPAPVVEDGSGQKIEEAIGQIGEPKKSNHLILSILIILVLLGLLGGAGYGLYYVLRPAPPAESTQEPQQAAPNAGEGESKESGGFLSNSIEAAKAAIAKIPAGAEEEAMEESAPDPAVEEFIAESALPSPEKAEPEQAPALSDNRAASFLTSAHIGGVRTGDRPKLILNRASYVPGDLVDKRFGLRFIGFRDEKLAFRDEKGIVYLKSF